MRILSRKLNMAIIFLLVILFATNPVYAIYSISSGKTEINIKKENLETEGKVKNRDIVVLQDGTYRVYFGTGEPGRYQIIASDGKSLKEIHTSDGTVMPLETTTDGITGFRIEPNYQYYYFDLSEEQIQTLNTVGTLSFSTPLNKADETPFVGTEETLPEVEGNIVNDFFELFEKVIAWFIVFIGERINGLISFICKEDLTIDALLFDRFSMTSLSFFDKNPGSMVENPILTGAKAPINFIFGMFQDISLVCYMIILVYMGIRVLLLSTADKKAKYKEIIFDWVKGIAILFFFPYVIKYSIQLNHAFVNYIGDNLGEGLKGAVIAGNEELTLEESESIKVDTTDNYMTRMYNDAKGIPNPGEPTNVKKESYRLMPAICWCVMLVQVIQFLIVYIKRLITIMFLIAIFPLVTISYAIDKIGDGKSQAFNSWFKEFIIQVFTQSFHAMNYVLVMGIAFQIDNWFLTIIAITYVSKGGDMLKGLFAQMQGGKAGGTMEVAKTLLKTKATLGAIKGLKSTASKMFGAQSTLGKGIGKLSSAYDRNLASKAAEAELNTRRELRARNVTSSIVDMRNGGFTDDELDKKLGDIRNPAGSNISNLEFSKNVNDLAKVSQEDLNKALDRMGITGAERKDIEGIINYSMFSAVVANRENHRATDVRISVDSMIKYRNENAGNPYLEKYDKFTPSNHDLYKIRASKSVYINKERAANRGYDLEINTDDEKTNVKNAIYAMKNAHKGENTISELNQITKIIERAKDSRDADIRKIYEEETKDMNFSFNDFKLNVAVNTINNYKDIEAEGIYDTQWLVDNAIREVNDSKYVEEYKEILSNLNTDIDKLEERTLPEIVVKPTGASKIRQEIKEKFENDPYSADLGEEYDQYLEDRIAELRREAKEEAVSGAGMFAAGTVISAFKASTGIATAGVVTGASTQGKGNLIDELAVAVPAAISTSGDIIDKATGAVVGAGNAATSSIDTIHTILTGSKPKSPPKINSISDQQKSMAANKKYYGTEGVNREIDRQINDAERERQRLMNELKKRTGGNRGNNSGNRNSGNNNGNP